MSRGKRDPPVLKIVRRVNFGTLSIVSGYFLPFALQGKNNLGNAHFMLVLKGICRGSLKITLHNPQVKTKKTLKDVRNWPISTVYFPMTPMEGTEHHLAHCRRRILGQYPAAPCSSGPFVVLLTNQKFQEGGIGKGVFA